MARTDTLTHFLTDVADAIRTKTGSSAAIDADDFDTEIENIPSGGGVDINDYYTSSIEKGVAYTYAGWSKTMKKLPPYTFSGTSCAYMFQNCPSQGFDLSNFNTSNTTTMEQMFSGCTEVETLNLSNLNTSRVTTMYYMFNGCTKLKTLTHDFDLKTVTNMQQMFSSCKALETIDFSNTGGPWTISNAGSMFSGCSSLRIADLSGIGSNQTNGSILGSATGMFYGCTSLEKIDIRNLKMNGMTSSSFYSNMFYNVPANCEIIVMNDTQKNWVNTNFPSLTNVKTVAEYEAEQNA